VAEVTQRMWVVATKVVVEMAQHSLMLGCALVQGACPLHWYTPFILWHSTH